MENSQQSQLLADATNAALQTISSGEAGVLRLRFGLDDGKHKTLDEVGNALGTTREGVRQMEVKGLKKLRHPSRAKFIVPFLPEKE